MRLLKCAFICLGITALLASAYVVKEGDTLWDLSDEFLKDPFACPKIIGDLPRLCRELGVDRLAALTGAAHGR